MTHYLHVDTAQVSRSEYRGYIREFDIHVSADSLNALEYEAYRVVEETEGLKAFVIIWNRV